MVRDIVRFNSKGLEVSRDPNLTIGDFLKKLGTGEWFKNYYLLPLSGAIWSTPTEQILEFPAHAMLQFFENHALLSHTGQHQWYTVDGGSVQYVTRLETAMRSKGVDIRLGAGIEAVTRNTTGVVVKPFGHEAEQFDDVIFATHSDDSLALLKDPTEQESRLLGAVKYQPNDIVLHADTSVMPKNRKCWSSWVYS